MTFFALGAPPKEVPPADYVYRCEDESYLKPFFYKVFVTPLSRLLTARTAPNDITFVSQVFALLPVVFALLLTDTWPRWTIALVPPLGFLGYIILDHLDGTHARRTGASSPLGELVDHWNDAWNGALVPFAWSMLWGGLNYPVVTTLLAVTGSLAYTFAIAEHKATGTLKLDRIGGNEGMVLMSGSLVALAFLGQERCFNTQIAYGYTTQHLLQFLHGVGCIGTVKNALLRTGTRVLADVLPLIVAAGLIVWWVALGLDPRLACFMLAAATAIVSGRLVLFRATGLAYRWDGLGLTALLLGLGVASTRPDAKTQLWTGSIVLGVLVVRAFADFGWGATAMARWIRRGETLSLFVAPQPAAIETGAVQETEPKSQGNSSV
jgi:phosphatidylglycerophosphate synthase